MSIDIGMRAGELCAGYGGLALAVEEVFGATTAWFCEFEEAPSKILAHHWPDVINYGDMTQVNWSKAEQVHVMSGGTPCQDLSHAGKRKGMTEGTRSNLWVHMREAIAIQRPLYVVWENVRGAYSAGADMGDSGDEQSVLRALGRVLGDLSDLGYDVQWRGLRASDVGAPHARFRVFVLARLRTLRHSDSQDVEGQRAGGLEVARMAVGSRERGSAGLDAADAYDLGYQRGWEARGRGHGLEDRREPAADASGSGLFWRENFQREGWDSGLGCEKVSDFGDGHPSRRGPTADTHGRDDDGRLGDAQRGQEQREAVARSGEGFVDAANATSDQGWKLNGDDVPVAWGDYEPAIRRWEHVIGRRAPRPTEPSDTWLKMITKRKAGLDKRPVGMRGSVAPSERLSPRFTEWMMGLPDGWVTDPAIGISRNEQLKACGNGVVPQQAIAALRDMLTAFQEEGIAA